jgi:hypothetical protein
VESRPRARSASSTAPSSCLPGTCGTSAPRAVCHLRSRSPAGTTLPCTPTTASGAFPSARQHRQVAIQSPSLQHWCGCVLWSLSRFLFGWPEHGPAVSDHGVVVILQELEPCSRAQQHHTQTCCTSGANIAGRCAHQAGLDAAPSWLHAHTLLQRIFAARLEEAGICSVVQSSLGYSGMGVSRVSCGLGLQRLKIAV